MEKNMGLLKGLIWFLWLVPLKDIWIEKLMFQLMKYCKHVTTNDKIDGLLNSLTLLWEDWTVLHTLVRVFDVQLKVPKIEPVIRVLQLYPIQYLEMISLVLYFKIVSIDDRIFVFALGT